MNKQFIQYVLSFCALVVIGLALRVVGLSFQPLWWDEGFSLYFATEAPARLLELTSLDIHPPLYYLLLQAWMAGVGIGALSARWLSVLVGVLALPVAWAVAQRFLGWREAWISVWLLALSPLHIFYSQEVRMYGLVTLWALLAVWAWQERRWVLLGLMVLAGMLTHYYFLFMALALALLIVGDARKGGYEALRGPLQALLVAVVGYLPWLIYAALRLIRYLEGKLEVEADTPMTPLEFLPRHLEAWSVGHLEPGWTWLAWGTWLFVALVLLGLSQREKKRGPHPPAPSPNTRRGGENQKYYQKKLIHLFSPLSQYWERGVGGVRAEAEGEGESHVTLLVLWLVPTGCVFLVGLVAPFVALRIERQLLFVLPFFLMLVARGVVVLWQRWSWGVLPVLLLITVINMGSLWGFYTVPRYPGEDYRPILADVGALQGPGDGWLAIYEWQIGYLRAYLPDAHPTPLLVPGTTPGADHSTSWVDGSERKEAIEAGVAGLLSEHRRIWFPAYQVKGRLLEEEVGQAFSETGASAWDEWYANTRLYLFGSAPPSWGALSANSSEELGLEVAGEFEGVGEVRATLGHLPGTWSGIGIIPLLIEVDKVPQGVRASVQLLSNDPQRGGVWGEWDGPIGADSETPPVTDLVDVLPQEGAQDERLQVRAGLPVAHGTPPGEYVVQLTLYASTSPPDLEGQGAEGQGTEGQGSASPTSPLELGGTEWGGGGLRGGKEQRGKRLRRKGQRGKGVLPPPPP